MRIAECGMDSIPKMMTRASSYSSGPASKVEGAFDLQNERNTEARISIRNPKSAIRNTKGF
jgi:hypothetical protein